jgi:glutathione S-transferase
MILHHLERSRSHRILWLLEELALPYELKTYKRDPKTMRASRDLRQIHPLGKSPLLEFDGEVFAESGAIVEAVLDHAGGRLRPTEPKALIQYRHWLHFAEGTLMTPLLIALMTSRMAGPDIPFLVRPIVKKVAAKIDATFTTNELKNIESHLAENTWFAGNELSGADIMMSFPIAAGVARAGMTTASHPHTLAWFARVEARPAYQTALERGGPVIIGA